MIQYFHKIGLTGPTRSPRRRTPRLETLEGRTLLAIDFTSAFGLGGSNIEISDTAIDAAGNVYLSGSFFGTVDFDPSATDFPLSSVGGRDLFVAKYSSSGNLIYAQSAGGTFDDRAAGIAVDQSGAAYVTGFFTGNVNFGSNSLSSPGADIFVWKLDPAGNPVFAVGSNGNSGLANQGRGIDVSLDGSVIAVTGFYLGSTTFGSTTLTATGGQEAFVTRLDGAGNFQFARALPVNADAVSQGERVAIDGAGSVISTGAFTGTVQLDPIGGTRPRSAPGDSGAQANAYVSKFDAAGNFVFGQAFGGPGFDQGTGIDVDAAGNVYTIGRFLGPVDFDPDINRPDNSDVLSPPNGVTSFFVLKLDPAGNFGYVRDLGARNSNLGVVETGIGRPGIGVDPSGVVFASAAFEGTAEIGGNTFTSLGGIDVFVARLDAAGNIVESVRGGGTNNEVSTGLAYDPNGGIALVGSYAGSPSFGGTTLNPIAANNVFVTQLTDLDSPRVLSIAGVSPDPRFQPLESVDVTLSAPINAASFTFQDVTLTRNGVAVPLNNSVTVTQTSDTTYQINGLRNFTIPQGQYQITVSGAGLTSPTGIPGTGQASEAFRKRRVAGDYDGDGITDLATYVFDAAQNRGRFDIQLSGGGTITQFIGGPAEGGTARDIPIEGDFDGDGKADIAVFQPEFDSNGDGIPDSGRWIIIDSSTGQRRAIEFGAPGILDRPAPADYDGDGITDIATFRPDSDLSPGNADWFILQSTGSAIRVQFGAAGGTDLPAPADYDGDGIDDIATYRPVSDLAPGEADWFILPADTSITAYRVTFGAAGGADQPVVADYDGDGRDDIAAFRSSSDLAPGSADWFILQTQAGARRDTYGTAGTIAAQGYYDSNANPDLTVFNPETGQWRIRNAADGSIRTVTFGATGSGAVPVLAPLAFRLIATGNQVGSSSVPAPASFASLSGQNQTLSSQDMGLAMLNLESIGSTTAPLSEQSSRRDGNIFDLALEDLNSGDQ